MKKSTAEIHIQLADEISALLSSNFPIVEREFAAQELARIRDSILIKGRQLGADLEIAESLQRAEKLFGKQSMYYQALLSTLKTVDENWGNKDWRKRMFQALKGYQRLDPENDPELREFVLTKCRSLSSLAEIQGIASDKLDWFKTDLQAQVKFPTAKQVRDFCHTNYIVPQLKVTTNTKPLPTDLSGFEDLVDKDEPLQDQPDERKDTIEETSVSNYSQPSTTFNGSATVKRYEPVSPTPAPIIDVTPNPQQPPSPMETLKEVATLLQRHSADDYFSIDTAEALKVLKPCLDVIDVLHEIPNRNSLKMRMVKRV